jgi:cold shock CspA family protein
VKWFNATESYGLSLAAAKTFHIWAVEKTGLSDLREGGNGAP